MTSYYHYDGQLSTRQLTDASQNITDTYTYDAFGLLLNRSGATENNYLYTGEQYDPNAGFYYLRARYYNPNNGRFINLDPFKGNIYDPPSLHKYLYCEGNPVGRWDPSGQWVLFVKIQEYTITALLKTRNVIITTGFYLMMRVRIVLYQLSEYVHKLNVFTLNNVVRYQRLLQVARTSYKHQGLLHRHHVVPKYIIRALEVAEQPVPEYIKNFCVRLDPRYHQLVTNAIRKAYPFGKQVFDLNLPDVAKVLSELLNIYSKYALPDHIPGG